METLLQFSIMNSQRNTLVESSERTKAEDPYEEMLKRCVEYRVCIARTELAPANRRGNVVTATSLNVHGHQSAGVGIEFKACFTSPFCTGH